MVVSERVLLATVRRLLKANLRHHVAAQMEAALLGSPDGYWFTQDMAGRLRKCAICSPGGGLAVARTVEFVLFAAAAESA